ncbi:MAG: zinc metallopeptidase [Clostridia bacterium]|nr:zinc metallopeptidase [Clostridia bacterium]
MLYFDPLYFVYMLPGLIIALIAQAKVKSSFNKYSQVMNLRGITGAQAAERILSVNGISNVQVMRVSGSLTDHYNPKDNTVYLSDSVYNSTSIAAIGVAAHEVGHALQYAFGYSPIKFRMALVPICNFGAGVSPFLIVLGYVLSMPVLLYAAIFVFSLSVLFQLVTLPVEFNASRRAIAAIGDYDLLGDDEIKGAKKVLSAAAMTYVAALLQSFLVLLYYIARFGNRRR